MKKLTKIIALISATAMLVAMAGCSTNTVAKDEPKKETLTLGLSADYAPYEFHKLVDGKDTIMGFDVELAKKIAADMGKELVITEMGFDLLIGALNDGKIDIVISGMNPDEKRAKQVDFSDVYYTGDQKVLILKADADKYKDYADLAGQQIAVQSGSIQEQICAEYFPDAEALSLQTVPDEISNLIAGKCAAVIVEGDVALGYAEQNDTLMVSELFVKSTNDGSAAAVKKGDPKGLLEQINKTIKAVAEDGSMDGWVKTAKSESAGIE